MFIRSERLFLRPGWPEDWAELLALIDDKEVVRNLARAPWPYRPEDARAFAGLPQAGRHPHFFITLPGADGARLIGSVGLIEAQGETEMGYWLARRHWNRGYATEAGRAVLSLARTLGHRRVVCSHFVDNTASGRVAAKLGFRPTGEIRVMRSPARSRAEPAVVHAIDLGGAGNGPATDGGGNGRRAEPFMRAA